MDSVQSVFLSVRVRLEILEAPRNTRKLGKSDFLDVELD
jgi:hypothetical protein